MVRLVAVGYGEPRSRRASTTQQVVSVSRLERIEEPIDLENLLAAVGERGHGGLFRWSAEPLERLRSGGVDHAEMLDPGRAAVVRSVLHRLSPNLAGVLDWVERGNERAKVGGAAAPIWRLERERHRLGACRRRAFRPLTWGRGSRLTTLMSRSRPV